MRQPHLLEKYLLVDTFKVTFSKGNEITAIVFAEVWGHPPEDISAVSARMVVRASSAVLNLVPWDANLLIRPSLFVQRKLLILSLSSWPRAIQGVRSHRVINSWTWKTFQCISPSDHSRLCGIRKEETNDSILIVGRGWTWVIFTF